MVVVLAWKRPESASDKVSVVREVSGSSSSARMFARWATGMPYSVSVADMVMLAPGWRLFCETRASIRMLVNAWTLKL